MSQPIVIVGAGITGLAIAYVLSHTRAPKYNIIIVARDLPGDLGLNWASPWAGAVFHPSHDASRTEQAMQTASFNFYHALALSSPSSGVGIFPLTEYLFIPPFPTSNYSSNTHSSTNSTHNKPSIWYSTLMPNYTPLLSPPTPRPSGTNHSATYTTVTMNPTLLLPWLRARLEARGVRFIRAEVDSLAAACELASVEPRKAILVNASGLGARILTPDKNVHAVRGQTIVLRNTRNSTSGAAPSPASYNRAVMLETAEEYTYVIPRSAGTRTHSSSPSTTTIDGVILGGVRSERTDSRVDGDVRSDILRRVNRVTGGAFAGSRGGEYGVAGGKRVGEGEGKGEGDGEGVEEMVDIVGFRPGREGGLRVERVGNVVHAYGMEGEGYIYSFGVAERVRGLIEGEGVRVRAKL